MKKGAIAFFEFTAPPDMLRYIAENRQIAFFEKVINICGMYKASPIYRAEFDGITKSIKAGAGISQVVIIEESHMALHTFPELKTPYAGFIIYTCGNWNEEIKEGIITAIGDYFHGELRNPIRVIYPDMPD